MSSCGKNENPQEMNRRKFLKVFGGGAVASSAALYGCAPKNEPGAAVALGEVPTDKMTYRQHPTNGDKVSILAYIIHSGFISGYQNRYGDNLKPPTNVYHRMTA